MSGGAIHHIDLTVSDLAASTDFYGRVVPLLGFRRSAPGLQHLAFAAPSRAAVDDAHRRLVALGVAILDAPADHPQDASGCYAVFFAEPDRLELEYVFTPRWPTGEQP